MSPAMYRRHIEKLARTRLDDVLLDEGLIDRTHVEDAQAETEMTGRQLSHILFERAVLDEWDLAKIVSRHYSLPFVDLTTYTIPREAEELLPGEFCREHVVLPFDVFGKTFALAVCEMPTPSLLDEMATLCERTPFIYVAIRSRIAERAALRCGRPGAEPAPVTRPAATKAPPPVSLRTTPRNRRDDLQPISMRLGFSMNARVAGKSAEHRPVAVATRNGALRKSSGGWESIFDVEGA